VFQHREWSFAFKSSLGQAQTPAKTTSPNIPRIEYGNQNLESITKREESGDEQNRNVRTAPEECVRKAE